MDRNLRFSRRGSWTKPALFLALPLLMILMGAVVSVAQMPPTSGVQTDPNNPNNAFGETSKAVQAAANGVPGSVDISAPEREAAHGSHEKIVVVDPRKDRKPKESTSHDPTFDGSGLFSDIKVAPTATPAPARINSAVRSTRASSGASFLGDTKLGSGASLGLGASQNSSPATAASPTPSPVRDQAENPSPTPTPSPTPSASHQD